VKLAKAKPKDQAAPSKHSAPAKAPRLTPAQKLWVKKADALCRESRAEAQAVVAQGNTSTPAGVHQLFARMKKVNAELNDRFLAIDAPAGYKDDVARIRVLFAKEERYFDSMGRALEQGDTKTFYVLSDRLTQIVLEETDILAELGAYGCDIALSSVFS
jgi:hypothetical protein